jgi:hypothetical protein
MMLVATLVVLLLAAFLGLTALVTWMLGRWPRNTEKPERR